MVNISTGDELVALEKKREALEETVRIALSIEHLHAGLEATLAMGGETQDIPQEVRDTLDELDEETRAKPSDSLRVILSTLEKTVQSNLDQILEIAEMDERQLANSDIGKIETLVNDFRKKAQTNIALRVLLHTRGEITCCTPFNAPADTLYSHLKNISEKERHYREVIKTELNSMIVETKRMLSVNNMAHSMRGFLELSLQDFTDNLKHIEEGKSITAMPVAIEMVEMSEHEISSMDTAPNHRHQQSHPTINKQTVYSPSQVPVSSEGPVRRRKPVKPSGLFSRIKEWATTPDEVKWKDLNQKKRR